MMKMQYNTDYSMRSQKNVWAIDYDRVCHEPGIWDRHVIKISPKINQIKKAFIHAMSLTRLTSKTELS